MGANNSKPLNAKAAFVRVEVANRQAYYTGGETITGEVLVDLGIVGATLHNVTVSLTCNEKLCTPRCLFDTARKTCADVDLVCEPVILNATYYRFPFELRTPVDSENYPPTMSRSYDFAPDHGVAWTLTGRMNASVANNDATKAQSQYICRTHELPVIIFPALPGPRSPSLRIPCYFSSDKERMRIEVRCAKEIPQAPEVCDIKLTIEPHGSLFVERVNVYLVKTVVLWTPYDSDVIKTELPLGGVTLHRRLVEKLQLNGRDLGWGLKNLHPEGFISARMCMFYRLSVVVDMIGICTSTQISGFYMAPMRPLYTGREQ